MRIIKNGHKGGISSVNFLPLNWRKTVWPPKNKVDKIHITCLDQTFELIQLCLAEVVGDCKS